MQSHMNSGHKATAVAPDQYPRSTYLVNGSEKVHVSKGEGLFAASVHGLGIKMHQLRLFGSGGLCARFGNAVKGHISLSTDIVDLQVGNAQLLIGWVRACSKVTIRSASVSVSSQEG